MTDTMIWTFGFLAWVAVMVLANRIRPRAGGRRYAESPLEGKLTADLTALHGDMEELKERLASIEQVLRQVE